MANTILMRAAVRKLAETGPSALGPGELDALRGAGLAELRDGWRGGGQFRKGWELTTAGLAVLAESKAAAKDAVRRGRLVGSAR